jgi:hypothetical protein
MRKNIFFTGPTRAAEAEKNILYRQNKPNEPTKEGPLSLVRDEYPFTSGFNSQEGPPLYTLSGFTLEGEQPETQRLVALPAQPSWTMGTDNLKLCTIGKKMFCTGPTGSAVQFFMLPHPSKIHRLNSVSTGSWPVNIL